MKTTEKMANMVLAGRLTGGLAFYPMVDGGDGKKPENGAKVLVHNWERETDDGTVGYDSWEVMRWLEAGTKMDLGVRANPDAGKSGEDELIRAITGKRAIQTIGEDGFYWKESEPSESGFCRWVRLGDGNCDCWAELPDTGKGDILREMNSRGAEDADADEAGEADGDEDNELLFQKEARLCDGTSIIVRTIASKDWKDGKPLPPDVGAFLWRRLDRKGRAIAGESGKFSARFKMPEDRRWDEDEIAEQVIRFILREKYGIENPDGVYDLI